MSDPSDDSSKKEEDEEGGENGRKFGRTSSLVNDGKDEWVEIGFEGSGQKREEKEREQEEEEFSLRPAHIMRVHETPVNDVLLATTSTSSLSLLSSSSGCIAECLPPTSERVSHLYRGRGEESLDTLSSTAMRTVTFYGIDAKGMYVMSSSSDKSCYIWSEKSKRIKYQLVGHQDMVASTKLSYQGDKGYSAGYDRGLKVWDLLYNKSSGKCVKTYTANSKFCSLDVSLDGNVLVSGHKDGGLRLWDVRSQDRICSVPNIHDHHTICDVHFATASPSSTLFSSSHLILTAGKDHRIQVLDDRTYEVVYTLCGSATNPAKQFRLATDWSRVSFKFVHTSLYL